MATITLEQLIALNDEIAALARAGVPIERGLVELARDLPGPLRKYAEKLVRRLESGESLDAVFADEDGSVPRVYRAMVHAGLRSGRLAVALEAASLSMRRLTELRRTIGLAIIYPLLVFVVGYSLFWFIADRMSQGMSDAFAFHRVEPTLPLRWLNAFVSHTPVWAVWLPILIVVVVCVSWWILSSQALVATPRWANWILGWVPPVRKILGDGRTAAFAEVTAMLVEQEVPLDESITLAAQTTGDPQLQAAAAAVASRIRQGEFGESTVVTGGPFPPVLHWLIASGRQQTGLKESLRYTADTYRRRAVRRSEWLQVYLPVLLSVGIGGTITLVFAVSVFAPWYSLLHGLAGPP